MEINSNVDMLPNEKSSILKRILKWLAGIIIAIILFSAFFVFNPDYFYAGIVMVYRIINLDYKKLDQIKDFEWFDEELKVKYSELAWEPIKISKAGGLHPYTEKSGAEYERKKEGGYIRREGGLMGYVYWLENASGTTIDSKEKLIETFAPLDTVEEAISYLAVQTSDITTATNTILLGKTLTTNDGYLIQLVKGNRFGCGEHLPTGIVYKVTKDGSFEKVASEKIMKKRDPFGIMGVGCVD